LNVTQYNPGTLLDEGFGRRSTNTTSRASNHRHLVCQSLIHCCFLNLIQFLLLDRQTLTAGHSAYPRALITPLCVATSRFLHSSLV
jgi:hypothetical protein